VDRVAHRALDGADAGELVGSLEEALDVTRRDALGISEACMQIRTHGLTHGATGIAPRASNSTILKIVG
jgi:hypothetical protein